MPFHTNPQPLKSSRCSSLLGEITPPGDKSISHRSIMLAGVAEGTSHIHGLLEGDDVMATVAALRAMGATIFKDEENIWHVTGHGVQALHAADHILDMGNSGTSARLLSGLVAGYPFITHMRGDASLQKRPMGRVTEPLSRMGATFVSTEGRLPMKITGAAPPVGITYELPVASAQVKSALLLAGLNVHGTTTVIEKIRTRDHSENMLRSFGAHLDITTSSDGIDFITLYGQPHLRAQTIILPADPSSAAFPLVAALMCPESKVTLKNVGLNPRRAGLITVLRQMGAAIFSQNERLEGGESVADLVVSSGALHSIDVPPEHAPSMIDEYPILAVAASFARGTTRMRGLGELRVKESDRLALTASGLNACGVKVWIEGDDLIVEGSVTIPKGGAMITTNMDHRIAMSFLVLGMQSIEPVIIDDGRFIPTSFPNFIGMMNRLGARISPAI